MACFENSSKLDFPIDDASAQSIVFDNQMINQRRVQLGGGCSPDAPSRGEDAIILFCFVLQNIVEIIADTAWMQTKS